MGTKNSFDGDVRVCYKGTMITREPERSIPGEPKFIRSTDGGTLMVREERCPHHHPKKHGLCDRRLGDSVVKLNQDWYGQVAVHCERCDGRVLIIASSS